MRPLMLLMLLVIALPASAGPRDWQAEWPRTDFARHAVPYEAIIAGGPPKDGIPPIDDPLFVPLAEAADLAAVEPVIGLVLGGVARAYPLRVLVWHEIVNDVIAGVPVAVTYCPLCNAAIVFDRRVGDRVLDFGTTGKLRHSDLIMYDRQTESWWQQFEGRAIVGTLTGTTLRVLPARLESVASFRDRAPAGEVLVPRDPGLRNYGLTPYYGYDLSGAPFLYRGDYPENVAPLDRVVRVGDRVWALNLLRQRREIVTDDGLRLTWTPGQSSAMHEAAIAEGMDVGNVVVQRRGADGAWRDVPYGVDYAFAFHAFHPGRDIVTE